MSDSAVRKKSEVRQKTVVRTLRFSPVEDETIRKKAEDSGLTVSAYIRNAALNSELTPVQMMLSEGVNETGKDAEASVCSGKKNR